MSNVEDESAVQIESARQETFSPYQATLNSPDAPSTILGSECKDFEITEFEPKKIDFSFDSDNKPMLSSAAKPFGQLFSEKASDYESMGSWGPFKEWKPNGNVEENKWK